MEKRTPEELIPYVEGFLNELYGHFSPNGCVSFRELKIKKTGNKYRLSGRLRCEVMKSEFNELHRQYKRKYDTPPTKETILSWIKAARELESFDDKAYKRDPIKHKKFLEQSKIYRSGRREQIRIQNHRYYKINKPRIDAKFREDKYYEKNKDRINAKRNARRAFLRELKKKQLEQEKIKVFNDEFQKAAPMIRNFFVGKTENHEELLQEIYVDAYKIRHKYKQNTNMSAWAIKIGLNINLQKLKKKRLENNKIVYFDEFNDELMGDAVDKASLDELHHDENQITYPANSIDIINEAINELNEKDKQLLELYMDDVSHTEIAKILNITVDYSKTRLYLIRIKLAKKIESLLNINIKKYGSGEINNAINRNARKKSYYFKNKQTEEIYGKLIDVGKKKEKTNG